MEKSKCRRTPTTIHVYFSKKKKDNCFLFWNNGNFVFIREKREDTAYVCDIVSQSLDNFFHDPCDSKLLNIAVLKNNGRQFKRVMVDYDDIQKKVICIPYERNYLLLPMLHRMERWWTCNYCECVCIYIISSIMPWFGGYTYKESDGEFHSLSQLCQEGIGEHWQISSYLYKLLYIITNTKIKVVISQYVLQTISYEPNHGVSMILCHYIFHRGYNRLHV